MASQRKRVLRFALIVVAVQAALALPGLVSSSYLDTPIGLVLVAPFFSVYILHQLGVPGLLEHDGACGWGWCAPTILGWGAIAIVWLAGVFVLAWILSRVFPGTPGKSG